MTIEELISYIDKTAWADVLSLSFSDEDLALLLSVTNDNSKMQYQINCRSVDAFRISDNYMEWMELENDSFEIQGYCSPATTYVMWSDTVDWPNVIGRITQAFAVLPELINPEHIRETKKHTDYRLPITVPRSLDSAFHSLLKELGVSAYVHSTREGKQEMQVLRFGQRSFIVAQGYEVNEAAV